MSTAIPWLSPFIVFKHPVSVTTQVFQLSKTERAHLLTPHPDANGGEKATDGVLVMPSLFSLARFMRDQFGETVSDVNNHPDPVDNIFWSWWGVFAKVSDTPPWFLGRTDEMFRLSPGPAPALLAAGLLIALGEATVAAPAGAMGALIQKHAALMATYVVPGVVTRPGVYEMLAAEWARYQGRQVSAKEVATLAKALRAVHQRIEPPIDSTEFVRAIRTIIAERIEAPPPTIMPLNYDLAVFIRQKVLSRNPGNFAGSVIEL